MILYSDRKLTSTTSGFDTETQTLEVKNITPKIVMGAAGRIFSFGHTWTRWGWGEVEAYGSWRHRSDSGLASEARVLEPHCRM